MNRIAAWMVALAMPIAGLAAEPAADRVPAAAQAAGDSGQAPAAGVATPGWRCRTADGGTAGCFGGCRRGNGPPYGAGYEARRQWQGGTGGPGRGMGPNGGRGARCGR